MDELALAEALGDGGLAVGAVEPPGDGESLVAAGRGEVGAGDAVADAEAVLVADLASEQDAEAAELQELVELGAPRPPLRRKYEQRSWELLAAARATKKAKRYEAEIARQRGLVERERTASQAMAVACPMVARRLGVKPTRGALAEGRATVVLRLAFMPGIKGDHPARNNQNRACAVVSSVLEAAFDAYAEAFFQGSQALLGARRGTGALATADDMPPLAGDFSQVKVVSWEWDETSQRLQALRAKALHRERTPLHGVAVQVMVQRGMLTLYEFSGDEGRTVDLQPIFVKGLRLQSTRADDLLEAMLRSAPVDLSDTERLNDLAAKQEAMVFAWCCDRASSNLASLRWYFKQVGSPAVDVSILPFAELCASHGVALVKGRATVGKTLTQTVSSFTLLTKNSRFMDAMRDNIIALINRHLQVKRERRPAGVAEANTKVVEAIFGEMLSAMRAKRPHTKRKTNLQEDLGGICQAFCMKPGCGLDSLVHYCWVERGSAEFEAGAAEGSACCKNREEAVERVAAPFINFVLNTSWSSGSASRWTYVVATFRRLCLGYCCNSLLPTALRDMQVHWNCAEGLEQTLLRLVAADAGDFHSRSRLRLLRVVRGLCHADSGWKAAILLTTLLAIDAVLFAILGNGEGGARARLYDLISVDKSLVARANQQMLELLQAWRPGGGPWNLFEVMGGAYDDESTRMWARAQILQLSAGLTDTFELRYSRPPWNLFRFIDPHVSREEKAAAYRVARDMDPHCRPLFLQKLLVLCPTFEAMELRGMHILRAVNDGVQVSVDFSERSHAQMRQDMKSSGRAKSASASANRVYCHQVRAELIQRGWPDFAAEPLAAPGCGSAAEPREEGVLAERAKPRVINTFLAFLNFRMESYKSSFSEGRPMTAQEMDRVRVRAREAWARMTPEEQDRWMILRRARRAEAEAQPHGHALLPAGSAKDSKTKVSVPLWLLPLQDSRAPLSTQALCSSYSRFVSRDARLVYDDPKTIVTGQVPARASALPPNPDGADFVFGCCNSRKNVCRFMLASEVLERMGMILGLLNKWVDNLGGASKQVSALLWLRGVAPSPPNNPETQPIDIIVLLCDAWASPKMQYLARCSPTSSGTPCFCIPPFPFVLEIMTRPNRLTDRFQQPFIITSDELAHEIALLGPGRFWEGRPLVYTMQGATSLLQMTISGAEGRIDARRQRVRNVRPAPLDREIFLGDPMATGTAAAGLDNSP